MEFPSGLYYTKDHEWAKWDEKTGTVTVGITDHAQDSLGDIVYLELPQKGRSLKTHETFGVVESIKAVSDLYSPVSGEVVETNAKAAEDPSVLNRAAYTDGWLMRLKVADSAALSGLMSSKDYEIY
ncbi:MAG TPA: glycine cleavage system protein GcvH, partial [Oligoflexia bacterium]|nr:glycine cleavage system protein GcvH [Oligoflexia bacterium]